MEVVAIEAPTESERFEHLRALARVADEEAPPHAWLLFVDGASGELWSPRRAEAILPGLKKAAINGKVIAASWMPCAMASPPKEPVTLVDEENDDEDVEDHQPPAVEKK